MRKLLDTINKNSEPSLAEQQIGQLFSFFWTGFEKELASIAGAADQVSHSRPVPELVGEVLERVRSIERQLAEKANFEEKDSGIRAAVEAHLAASARDKEQKAKVTFERQKLKYLELKLMKLQNQRLELGQKSQEATYADEKERIEKSLQEVQEQIAAVKTQVSVQQD